MTFARQVIPELLDGLTATDPAAVRSRLDLQRVHYVMGTRSILLRALRNFTMPEQSVPLRMLEIGAGDGSLMLSVARALGPSWGPVELTLLDRQALLDPNTTAAYAQLGWVVTNQISDVHDWARMSTLSSYSADPSPRFDLIIANLFLHHFDHEELPPLLGGIALGCERFVACEPRRSRLALLASQLIGVIGVGPVTRTDAVLSVRAGFVGSEISDSWPASTAAWESREYAAGRFSHCFVAARTPAVSA